MAGHPYTKRQKAQQIRAFLLHFEEGMSYRRIAKLFGDKTPEQVAEMVKLGERLSTSESGEPK